MTRNQGEAREGCDAAQVRRESPPADFVEPALRFLALRAGLFQTPEVLAAEGDGEALALFAAPLEDGDVFKRRLGTPEAAWTRHGCIVG